MGPCQEQVVAPLPVPDKKDEQEAKYNVVNVGEDVVEVWDLYKFALDRGRAEKVVVTDVLVPSGHEHVVLAVRDRAKLVQ